MYQDIETKLPSIETRLEKIKKAMDISKLDQDLSKINQDLEMEQNWSDSEKMKLLMKEKKRIGMVIDNFYSVYKRFQDLKEVMDLASEDAEILKEVELSIKTLEKDSESLELKTFFRDEEDFMNSFLEINAGTGGTDSQDWVAKMVRMYSMWGEDNGYSVRTADFSLGEEAGFKKVILEFVGNFAFGYLKNENGIHRLVRISPFNANGKRQTSFASVFAYPAISDEIRIEIDPKDIRTETYRSSGAGGQHVNTTDSAVRLIHIPTGIVVQSQNQRSQNQNKSEAMKILYSKIYALELDKKNRQKTAIESEKSNISWGNQIRNYVFNPYKLVKDLRSGYQTSNVDAVMDGGLNEIIHSVISHQISTNQ